MGREFQLIALTLPGVADPSVAIAASRAGGIGVLDLEYIREEQAARAAITKLAKYVRRGCGVKFDGGDEKFVADMTLVLPEQIEVVILIPHHPDSLRRQVQACRNRNLRVWLETARLEQALLGEELGVDGLVAKGHEAGGWVGEETSFILLQRLIKHVSLPIWVQGGIGIHTAAACYAAGAAGVVLDTQLALIHESPLPETARASIARMDGSETSCLGDELDDLYRLYARSDLLAVRELQQLAKTFAHDLHPRSDIIAAWRQEVRGRVGWGSPVQHVWPLGQDVAFAAPLAERFRTVGGVIEGMRQAIDAHVRTSRTHRPLAEGAPLARSHGTRYPIVQGPMTRVSDRAAFAAEVAKGGALPFLALALMRAPEVEELLQETCQRLGDQPWGVGILGFVPLNLRQEQLEVIRAYKPSFALIAGGRPDQALILEQADIPTYLHIPSPGLLKLFIEGGARRFVFEGRECGGHVGPRSSFVLWDTMVDTLLGSLAAADLANCHVLFAGGIHDAVSASVVATLAAPLAEAGARVGVLLGTAYLYTAEAVATGAIVEGFQQEAIRCTRTVLLESGPGHATRCAKTPYAEAFEREKQRLSAERGSVEDIRTALEELNVGRLRIASKGIDRHPRYTQASQAPKFTTLNKEEQYLQGMYMIGQVAALRDSTCTIAELHREVSAKGSERLSDLAEPALSRISPSRKELPCDVAIIGMACLLPKAANLQEYWENILNKVDAITEVPEDRWDWRRYFDSDPETPDKIYSRWGGFLKDIPFDPMRYGMPPSTIPSIEPLQLLTLEVVRAALEDAGYVSRPFPRQRTSVILGAGGGVADLGNQYAVRSALPMLVGDVSPEVLSRLPEWTEDSFAGILLNVAAGRVANRFDLGGVNYTVDAACASSLAAVYLATRELEAGTSDMVIVGGVDTVQNPFGYLCFSKTHALSPRGRCRTFDESADGIVISEGLGVLVLKRLADAERDGDRIYAVIKSIAGSSDGRERGLTAPRPEGQTLALERAYAKAGFSPATVGLIEAHGTGTVAGDQAEVETLKRVFGAASAARQGCAIGSVKSMIGHTKCTAGVAGLIKVALALHHKVIPPTMHVDKPNPKACFPESPFYVNTDARPWIDGIAERPRRAGVSAFGFGGTNFHAVLEEAMGNLQGSARQATSERWPAELFLWAANSRQDILAAIEPLTQALARGAKPALRDLAYTLWQASAELGEVTLAVVATSLPDLQQKLAQAREALQTPGTVHIHDPKGIYCAEEPLARAGKVAFLFPGQGSQYPDMLRELSIYFPEVRECFELAERTLAERLPERLSSYVFPPPRFSPEEERICQQALTQTDIAQPALAAASMGLFHLFQTLGIRPDCVAGHSYGEYVALCSAAVFSEEVLYALSEARGRCIIEAAHQDLGTMAAVPEGRERTASILKAVEGVWIANVNAPRQTVIAGTRQGVVQAIARLGEQGIQARPLAVACAFHSPIIALARDSLAGVLTTIDFKVPQREVFSNASAGPYPHDPKAIAALLAEHLVKPVQFADEIAAMYRAGARIFVEVGPRNILTGLTGQILGDRPHLAVASDTTGRSGLLQLQHLLGQLAAHGLPLKLDRLYEGRAVQRLNLAALEDETRDKPLPPTTWLVNGSRARPLHEADALVAAQGSSKPQRTTGNGKVQGSASAPATPTASAAAVGTKEDGPAPPPTPEAPRRSRDAAAAPPEPVVPLRTHSTPGIPLSPPSTDEAGGVMLQFQRLMSRFVETQQQVMLAYLRGSSNGTSLPTQTSTTAALPHVSPTPAQPSQPVLSVPPPSTPSHPRVSAKPESPATAGYSTPSTVEPSNSAESPAGQEPQPFADRDQLTKKLLHIVSERTGYPPEMLDLDLDIEAELGIDSIKRVEILGSFQRACLSSGQVKPQEAMERLTGIKTLRAIVDTISGALTPPPVAQPVAPSHGQGSEPARRSSEDRGDGHVQVPRFLLTAVDAPLEVQSIPVVTDRVFLITDDERGVAQSLAEMLRRHGGHAAMVRMDDAIREVGPDIYAANLIDPTAAAEILEMVRERHGPVAGIIHLLPLKFETKVEEIGLSGWQDSLQQRVKSLFYLAKAAGPDLKQAGTAGGGWLMAATAMGGTFASDGSVRSFFPGDGAIAGLIKTLALEWPQVSTKVVDLEPSAPSAASATHLLAEMAAQDSEVEVGYRGSHRLVLQLRRALLDEETPPKRSAIDASSVVLVTGGARGITAEMACDLAARYRPTLLLVGRSPLPEPEESSDTVGLTSPRELKAALMNHMRQRGQEVTAARVEAAYSKVLRDREIRSNLAAMERAGASVRYYPLDVRDASAFGNLIEEIYRSYGRIDGVVHGAGIIEDKLVEDKTADSFDRVFDTKVNSAFILSRKLWDHPPGFFVMFSSVAGRFGNRGQSDYAAGNEVLNKLAIFLDRRWPGLVKAINWGPWRSGMVSPEVQQRFAERGVQLIPPEAGRRTLDRELCYGSKGEAEVILGGGPWKTVEMATPPPAPASLPLLGGLPLSVKSGGAVEVIYRFDPRAHPYLQDHQLDAKPVLPAAMAMELVTEVVQTGWPEWQAVGIRAFRVLKGIVLGDGHKSVRVLARPQTQPSHERLELDVNVEITELEPSGHACYRATVQLAERLPEPPTYELPCGSGLREFPMTVNDAYRHWLFHGPRFQCISRIEGIGDHGIVATVVPSSPHRCLEHSPADQWLIDPIVIDSGPQLAILWARAYKDMTALPSSFQSYRRYGPLSGSALRCYFQVLPGSADGALHANVFFVSTDGRLLGVLEDLESTCSKALNRLTGSHSDRTRGHL